MLFYWIFFTVYCIGHLVTCYFEKELPRKITKVFIIPLLIVGLLLSKTYNLFLFIGLTLGWVGDILLLFNTKKRYFVIGGISFMLGHIAYIASAFYMLLKKYDISITDASGSALGKDQVLQLPASRESSKRQKDKRERESVIVR